MTFHTQSFSCFAAQLPRKLSDLCDLLEELLKLFFPGFMNENLAIILDEGRSIRHFYLNSMRLFRYDLRNKKKW